MPSNFPYTHSAGPLLKTIEHLRSSFPAQVTAETLKKLGVAPKNESYVINVLRFIGVIDKEGKKVAIKADAFLKADDSFAKEFEKLVKAAYKDLFDLHGEKAWKLNRAELTTYFRTSDRSSEVVGKRQAATFGALAALAGHSELPSTRDTKLTKGTSKPKVKKQSKKSDEQNLKEAAQTGCGMANTSSVGLTVRIEVNLPADGDQQTYDRIFRSIRENLIDVEKY